MDRDAVVVEAVRTPVGKRGGGLSGVHPADLSATVLAALAERAGIEPGSVEDVIWGCVGQVGEQSFDIARTAALSAGWPEHVPGVTLDRQCGSSQQAISFVAAGVIAGHYDLAVAGGVEVMSRVPLGSSQQGGSPLGELYARRYGPEFPNQGVGAERIAGRWGIARAEMDEFSLASHAKAAAAADSGAFAGETVPVETGDGRMVTGDEGIRRGGTPESMARLRPAFRPEGSVTAGNASQISDGAAAVLVTTAARAAELGLRPIAQVHTCVVVGSAPMPMLTGPIPATRRVLARGGLSLDEIGAIEINEAFASVVLAWMKELRPEPARVNPLGGAIALGHPLGASGARLATTLLHHMRRERIRFGLQVMCEGGGQANATLYELI